MARDATATREQIIAAADELFYGEGIRAASMDAIAARACVTKRTLYYHFRSKDDLIAAYLAARDEPTLDRFKRWLGPAEEALPERIAAMFARFAKAAASERWKGCGFIRAAAELADKPGHPALKIASAHKKRFEAWLADEIAAAGLADAPRRARHVMILLDGAVAEMLMHRDPSYADAAGRLAASVLTG